MTTYAVNLALQHFWDEEDGIAVEIAAAAAEHIDGTAAIRVLEAAVGSAEVDVSEPAMRARVLLGWARMSEGDPAGAMSAWREALGRGADVVYAEVLRDWVDAGERTFEGREPITRIGLRKRAIDAADAAMARKDFAAAIDVLAADGVTVQPEMQGMARWGSAWLGMRVGARDREGWVRKLLGLGQFGMRGLWGTPVVPESCWEKKKIERVQARVAAWLEGAKSSGGPA